MKFAWWKYEGDTRLREVVLEKVLEAHRDSRFRAGVRKGASLSPRRICRGSCGK